MSSTPWGVGSWAAHCAEAPGRHGEQSFSIPCFQVTGRSAQAAFPDAYRPVVERHVSSWPGFVGATLHASTDGTRIVATVLWRDESSYQRFLAESDAEARMDAITAVFDAVPGVRVPQMDRVHTYRIATVVPPTPLG